MTTTPPTIVSQEAPPEAPTITIAEAGGSAAAPPVVIPTAEKKKSGGMCDRFCNVFAPLDGVILLGDTNDEEDGKFGNALPVEPVWLTAFRQFAGAPPYLLRTAFCALPYLIPIICVANLPSIGVKDATPLTAGVNAWVGQISTMVALGGLISLIFSCKFDAPHLKETMLFMLIGYAPTMVLQFAGLYYFQDEGKTKAGGLKKYALYNIILPVALCQTVAAAKILSGQWYPKWYTFWCTCKGLNKRSGACLVPCLLFILFQKVLDEFMKMDTLVLSANKSNMMKLVRPMMFFFAKKAYYHAYSYGSRLRHSYFTLGSMFSASVSLGVATAIMFTNSREWTQVIFFMVLNWCATMMRLWMLYGSIGSDKPGLNLIAWYNRCGKPKPDKRMKLGELRGFEVIAQSAGTSIGLVMICILYPICLTLGEDSMLYMLLFPTSSSIIFVMTATINEIAQDIFSKTVVMRRCKNDFSKHFSMVL